MSEIKLINANAFSALRELEGNSIDALITDPPYFLDKLKNEWDQVEIKKITKSSRVTSLPAGMRFDPKQGKEFAEFMSLLSEEAIRVLKPGGFYLSFSAPRLVHRLGVAIEDAGFEIRDIWAWLYTQNQMKAMSLKRFLDKENLTKKERKRLEDLLSAWKTPQIKSVYEPIICAQKPVEGTYLNNFRKYGVGLINTEARTKEGLSPANILSTDKITSEVDRVFLVPKPKKEEKAGSSHLSVKPLSLMEQLVKLVAPEGSLVLDPFTGSGTTAIAALNNNCSFIGFELDQKYFDESKTRIKNYFKEEGLRLTKEGNTFVGQLD